MEGVNKSDIIIALSIILLTEMHRSGDLGRIIKTASAGKDRKLLEKGIVISIRELTRHAEPDEVVYDLVAYIALSLLAIGETIDESVAAWEKRGYWLKADHYRMEWNWTTSLGRKLEEALNDEKWAEVAAIIARITQKMSNVNVSQNHRLGSPWQGAWEKLKHIKQ